MGTRGLTAVMADGEYKLAQYGQWDHYPSGQGAVALKFCQQHLKTQAGRDRFKEKLKRVQFSKDQKELEASTFIREQTDWVAGSRTFGKPKMEPYPYAGRDNGAGILNVLWDMPEDQTMVTQNEIAFSGDSLFCEFAYVIDLDKNTFEVFRGFNKRPLGQKQRFKDFFQKAEKGRDQYHPVVLLKSFDLENLPTKAVFLEVLEPKEE